MVLASRFKGRIMLRFPMIPSWTKLAKEGRRNVFGWCREMFGAEALASSLLLLWFYEIWIRLCAWRCHFRTRSYGMKCMELPMRKKMLKSMYTLIVSYIERKPRGPWWLDNVISSQAHVRCSAWASVLSFRSNEKETVQSWDVQNTRQAQSVWNSFSLQIVTNSYFKYKYITLDRVVICISQRSSMTTFNTCWSQVWSMLNSATRIRTFLSSLNAFMVENSSHTNLRSTLQTEPHHLCTWRYLLFFLTSDHTLVENNSIWRLLSWRLLACNHKQVSQRTFTRRDVPLSTFETFDSFRHGYRVIKPQIFLKFEISFHNFCPQPFVRLK